LLFFFLFLQVIIKTDKRKCYVKHPKNDINDAKKARLQLNSIADNYESEVETLNVINPDNENDSESEYDSYVESINNVYTTETTDNTVTISIITTDNDEFTTSMAEETTTTTVENKIPTPTQSCIKDPSIKCIRRNNEC